jgi:hypothetical protein
MRIRALLVFAGSAALAAWVPGCLSPTLPLPPPVVESVTEGASGYWEITGECFTGADVWVKNVSVPGTPGWTIACSATGLFNLAVAGKACDRVDVVQVMDQEFSPNGFARLQATQNATPVNPSACGP